MGVESAAAEIDMFRPVLFRVTSYAYAISFAVFVLPVLAYGCASCQLARMHLALGLRASSRLIYGQKHAGQARGAVFIMRAQKQL